MFLSKIIETKIGDYIYDAVNNEIVPLDLRLSNEIKNGIYSRKYFQFIEENNYRDFSKPVKFNLINMFYGETWRWLIENRLTSILLCVTENCNLRCEYCIYMNKYNDNNYIKKTMSEEIAFKAIDFLMKSSKSTNNVNIGFYGGEPFLRFDLIKNCVKYCRKNYPFKIPLFTTTTNGVLLCNDEVIDFIIQNNFDILISLDGPKECHDEHRKDKFGKASFDTVFENLFKIYMKNPKYFKTHIGFSAVQTPVNCTSNQYDFLDNLCKSRIIHADAYSTDYFKEILKHKLNKFNVSCVDTSKYEFIKKNILAGMKKYHDDLRHHVKTYDISPGGFCIPGVRKSFVTPDGKILTCEKVDETNSSYVLGDVFNGIDLNKIENLCKLTNQNLSRCRNCWAAKLSDFCFQHVFSLTDEFCDKCSREVYYNLKYYIEEIKNKKNICTLLENLSVE